ncbi:MAG: DUF5615 family PIN-like protein [Candidatus Kapaibacterium sp.]
MDEHIAQAVISGLRLRGVDALSTGEAGMLGASDIRQLAFAKIQQRVLVTQDDDFLRLHNQHLPHEGIVYAAQGTSVGQLVRGLFLIFQVLTREEMQNHIEFL